MADFRKVTPSRRSTVPDKKHYGDYKPILREDFDQRCGYCGDHDFFSETYYEVDHFVPKGQLKTLSETTYTNLVYSCRSCNNSKRAKWPTKDEMVHNDGKQGFIDPCHADYAQQFERLADGSVHAITELGQWMWRALNMGNPSHRLKWKLEQLRVILMKTDKLEIDDPDELRQIKELNAKYRSYEETLKGYPIFG